MFNDQNGNPLTTLNPLGAIFGSLFPSMNEKKPDVQPTPIDYQRIRSILNSGLLQQPPQGQRPAIAPPPPADTSGFAPLPQSSGIGSALFKVLFGGGK